MIRWWNIFKRNKRKTYSVFVLISLVDLDCKHLLGSMLKVCTFEYIHQWRMCLYNPDVHIALKIYQILKNSNDQLSKSGQFKRITLKGGMK